MRVFGGKKGLTSRIECILFNTQYIVFVWSRNGAYKTKLLKDILGKRINIMWEEHIFDPPIAHITCFEWYVSIVAPNEVVVMVNVYVLLKRLSNSLSTILTLSR